VGYRYHQTIDVIENSLPDDVALPLQQRCVAVKACAIWQLMCCGEQRWEDGCIVWNAQNTLFGWKRLAICAQAVYFLHSARPSVTRLNSRW